MYAKDKIVLVMKRYNESCQWISLTKDDLADLKEKVELLVSTDQLSSKPVALSFGTNSFTLMRDSKGMVTITQLHEHINSKLSEIRLLFEDLKYLCRGKVADEVIEKAERDQIGKQDLNLNFFQPKEGANFLADVSAFCYLLHVMETCKIIHVFDEHGVPSCPDSFEALDCCNVKFRPEILHDVVEAIPWAVLQKEIGMFSAYCHVSPAATKKNYDNLRATGHLLLQDRSKIRQICADPSVRGFLQTMAAHYQEYNVLDQFFNMSAKRSYEDEAETQISKRFQQ